MPDFHYTGADSELAVRNAGEVLAWAREHSGLVQAALQHGVAVRADHTDEKTLADAETGRSAA